MQDPATGNPRPVYDSQVKNDFLAMSFNIFVLALFSSSYYYDTESQYGDDRNSFFYIINIVWLIITAIPYAFAHLTFASESIATAANRKFNPNSSWLDWKESFRRVGYAAVAFHQTVVGVSLRNLFEKVFKARYVDATIAAVILGFISAPLVCSFLCYKLERQQTEAAQKQAEEQIAPAEPAPIPKTKLQHAYLQCIALLTSNTARLAGSLISTLAFTVAMGGLYIITLLKSPMMLEARKTPLRLGHTLAESMAYIIIILWNIVAVVGLTTSFLNLATIIFKYRPTPTFERLVPSIKRKTAWSTITSLTLSGMLSLYALLRKVTPKDSEAARVFSAIIAIVIGCLSTAFMRAVFYDEPVTAAPTGANARTPVPPIRIAPCTSSSPRMGTTPPSQTPEEDRKQVPAEERHLSFGV